MWYVVLVTTNNGQRIGITQEPDGTTPILWSEDEELGDHMSHCIADYMNIAKFDNDTDVAI